MDVKLNGVLFEPELIFELFVEMASVLIEHKAVYRRGTKQDRIEVCRKIDYVLGRIEKRVIEGNKIADNDETCKKETGK